MAVKTDKFIGNKIESLDGTFSIDIKDLGTGDLSNAVVSGSFDASTQTLTLTKGDNSTIDIDLSSLAGGGSGGGTDTNTYITAAELNGTMLKLTRNDGQEFNVDLASIDTKDAETIKGKQIDTLPTEPLILMFNPNTQKFEFTALPTCEQGNIIVPTYTRVDNTPFALEDIEQLITNRITKVNAKQSTPYEPLRYICLEPNNIVPINKGVLQNYREFSLANARMRLNTNGDILFYLDPVANTISKYDFDMNLIETIELNDDIYDGAKITAVSKNGKRVFTGSGIYDYNQNTNKYERVSDKQFYRKYYGQYRCNSCANVIIDDYYDKVYRLVDGGTWEEISTKTSEDNYNFSDYGFGKAVWRKSSTELAIGEFDENFNLVEEESFDIGETIANYPAISSDFKIVAVATTNYKILLFVKDINTNTFIMQGKIITSFSVYDLIFSRNQNKLFIIGDNKVATVDIMMSPSMYCGQEKTYTLDETLDLTQGNIALNSVNSFCRDKRNAVDSNARTFFINDNEANTGDIFFVDLINDSKQMILNVGNSVKYMIQKDSYLLLQLEDGNLKYYDITDLSNPVEITLPDLSNYYEIYIQNCDIFDGDLAISARDSDNNRYLDYYTLDKTNNTFTKDTSKSTTSNLTQQRYWQNNKNIEVLIMSYDDINTGEYLHTDINISDTLGNSSTLQLNLGKNASLSYKIIGDLLVFYAANIDENLNTTSYDLVFVCIEDINNIKFIEQASAVSNGNLTNEQVLMLFNEYNKSQKTIFKYKDNSTLETFSLLV